MVTGNFLQHRHHKGWLFWLCQNTSLGKLPCAALSFDTRIKFLLGHIGFLCHIKGHSRSSSLVLASQLYQPWVLPPPARQAKNPHPFFYWKKWTIFQPETSEPPFNPDLQNTGAISKKKPGKKTQSSHSDDPSASVENLICLEILRKESLATWLQITETQVKLTQLNTSFLLQLLMRLQPHPHLR